MARMNSTTVNEYGRDPDKGEVVFLAQCQCFRAELDIIKRNSSFLADIYSDHVVRVALIACTARQVLSTCCSESKRARLLHSTWNECHCPRQFTQFILHNQKTRAHHHRMADAFECGTDVQVCQDPWSLYPTDSTQLRKSRFNDATSFTRDRVEVLWRECDNVVFFRLIKYLEHARWTGQSTRNWNYLSSRDECLPKNGRHKATLPKDLPFIRQVYPRLGIRFDKKNYECLGHAIIRFLFHSSVYV